jgi:hypothetical protein
LTTIEQVLGTGWEDQPVFPGPPDVVGAPTLRPAPLSLVSAVPVFDTAPVANNLPPDDMPPSQLPGPSVQRWVQGFQFLPEEIGPADGYAWCSDVPMPSGRNCLGPSVVSAFEVIELDERSTAGIRGSDAMERVVRGLMAHEAWRVENEWWTGTLNPDNAHLNGVNPFYPMIEQGGDPYTATGLLNSLGLLEQAIASHDAGMGIIHCTPYVFNAWAMRGGVPFRYDGATPMTSAHIWTPNGNLVVPGYGYDGSAPRDAAAILNPQWQTSQWAYATDMVQLLRGPIIREPDTLEHMAPAISTFNSVPWRATRPWAIYSNGALRAAVFVDTTTP